MTSRRIVFCAWMRQVCGVALSIRGPITLLIGALPLFQSHDPKFSFLSTTVFVVLSSSFRDPFSFLLIIYLLC